MLWVPAHRILEIVDSTNRRPWHSGHVVRRLNELRNGRQQFVSIDTAFGILCELDLEYLLHIPQEDGGLADIYEDGKQYGGPGDAKAEKTRLRLATRETKRESWRESKRRGRGTIIPTPERICEECGDPFVPDLYANKNNRFCGSGCRMISRGKRLKMEEAA